MYNESYDKVSDINKLTEEFKLDTALCSDPVREAEREDQFNIAEKWLNHLGIKTRTEYGNLLPTYNLFLEIGEYLQRRITEEKDE